MQSTSSIQLAGALVRALTHTMSLDAGITMTCWRCATAQNAAAHLGMFKGFASAGD